MRAEELESVLRGPYAVCRAGSPAGSARLASLRDDQSATPRTVLKLKRVLRFLCEEEILGSVQGVLVGVGGCVATDPHTDGERRRVLQIGMLFSEAFEGAD